MKAKRVDALNARLSTAQAAVIGRLADPTDLPFTDDLLDGDGLVDEAKVHAAVEDLVSASLTWPPADRPATPGREPGPKLPR